MAQRREGAKGAKRWGMGARNRSQRIPLACGGRFASRERGLNARDAPILAFP